MSAPEQDVFRGEARPHRREHPKVPGRELAVLEETLQDEQDRDAGHVSEVAQDAARVAETARFHTQHLLEGVEHLRPAGMQDVVFELVEIEAQGSAGLAEVVAQFLAHDQGHALRELNLQAGLYEIPAHDVLGIGPGRAVATEQLRAPGVKGSDQYGCGAVGEEAGRDEVALGAVAPLEGEAGELYRDQEDELVGVEAGVLGGAGEARGPGGAAQAPDRDAPRVLREAQREDQLRVERGRREAGRRDEEDRTDVPRVRPHLVECPAGGLLGEVEGVLDVEGVLLREGMILPEPLHGYAEMAVLHVDVVEDRGQTLDVSVDIAEHAPGELLGLVLANAIGRQGTRHGDYAGVRVAQRLSDRVSKPGASVEPGSGSGCSQVFRKTYCESRLRCRLDQSMVGRRCSLGTYPSR